MQQHEDNDCAQVFLPKQRKNVTKDRKEKILQNHVKIKNCKPTDPLYFLPSDLTDQRSRSCRRIGKSAYRRVGALGAGSGSDMKLCRRAIADITSVKREWRTFKEDLA